MATRSATLGKWSNPGDEEDSVFTVPTGVTWLLKSVYASLGAGNSPWVTFRVDNGAGGFSTYILSQAGTRYIPIVWYGWLAMGPGSKLYVFSQTNGSSGWASGAKLLGVAP